LQTVAHHQGKSAKNLAVECLATSQLFFNIDS
jgi:hypothetical protein